MRKLFNILLYPIKLVFILLIYFYKIFISPFFPKTCRFTPSCSTYSIQAFQKHGTVKGFMLSANRILRCNPKNKGGEDFVPINLKGEDKWLF